jgi:PilZ domain
MMKTEVEKRAARRLELKLPMEYHRSGSHRNLSLAKTINISTSGVLFETSDDIQPGDRLALELGIVPEDERFPQNSKISTTAEVVRCEPLNDDIDGSHSDLSRYGVAARFIQEFKLVF